MPLLIKKLLSLNKRSFFLLILLILCLLTYAENSTEEVELFLEKVQELGQETKDKILQDDFLPEELENEVNKLHFYSKINDIINSIKEEDYKKAYSLIEQIKQLINDDQKADDEKKIQVLNYELIPVSSSSLKIKADFINSSKELLEDFEFRVILKDSAGEKITENIFPASSFLIEPDKRWSQNIYFFNLKSSEIIDTAEFLF
ncbi:MAG: hypothetical protein ACQESP_00605 [Candidatus Muiribacteriota bacterium]